MTWVAIRRLLRERRAQLVAARAELAVSLVILLGWLFLTAGVAALLGPVTWWISGGLLCWSLAGWKFLGTIARHGLYTLTRKERPNA